MDTATPPGVEGGDVKTGAQRGTMQHEVERQGEDSAQPQEEAQRIDLPDADILLSRPTPTHASVRPSSMTHQREGCIWEDPMRQPDESVRQGSDTPGTIRSTSPDEMQELPSMLNATDAREAVKALLQLQRDRGVDPQQDAVSREDHNVHRGARPKEMRQYDQLLAEQRQETPYDFRGRREASVDAYFQPDLVTHLFDAIDSVKLQMMEVLNARTRDM